MRPPSAPPGAYGATLVFGGAMHVDQEDRHPWLAAEKEFLTQAVEGGSPVLGVCLGAQLVAEAAGGRASRAAAAEIGWRELEVCPERAADPLLASLPSRFGAFEWHSYEIEPPPGAVTLARSDCCLQAFRAGERAWGIQFHAEVTRATVAGWVAKDGDRGELSQAGIDPAVLMAQTERRIAESNRLGIHICERFLALAGRPAGAEAC